MKLNYKLRFKQNKLLYLNSGYNFFLILNQLYSKSFFIDIYLPFWLLKFFKND